MKLRFMARGTTLTPDIREYCEKRLGELVRLFGKIMDVDVILTQEKNRRKAELNLKMKGKTVVVSEETDDMTDAVKRALDSLESKLKKEKGKWLERKRRGGRARKQLTVYEEEEKEARIVNSASYSHKPMPVEEAVLQLRGKNREVFMFRRDDSDGWAVVYKRKDGNFGLILPE